MKRHYVGSYAFSLSIPFSRKDTIVHHSAKPVPSPQSEAAKTVLVSEFAQRFRLDQVEENRLRKLLGPIAKEIDLLRNAGR